ncbi:MAG TPA: signal peptidase I [Solirubrobacteraceae bacterium]|jgi:signal peptidase I|nr:signal peptidase I [Solirubrobacteraceae bacterium]
MPIRATPKLIGSLLAVSLMGGCGSAAATSHRLGAAAQGPPPSGPGIYRVPGGSMEPTLKIGTRVTAKEVPPVVGAIVVLHPPVGAEEQLCGPKPHTVQANRAACDHPIPHEARGTVFVKRIVAGPGDEVYLRAGHVYRKLRGSSRFVREADSYSRPCTHAVGTPCDFPMPITIPAGHWFLLGDNRGESDDSRFWGPVPASWIVGEATVVWRPTF